MLQKQSLTLNFAQGLDTKTDPKQVQFGKFLELTNSVFTKGGLLKKRNGYGPLLSPPESASYATTFNGDLTLIGSSLQAYSSGAMAWVNRGDIQPISLSVLPLIRNNANQSTVDTAIAPNGYICTVYTENVGGSVSFKYAIADSVTGQNIVSPTAIPADTTYGFPKVFVLVNYFVVVYTTFVSGSYHLVYKAIRINQPTVVTAETTITTSFTPSTRGAFDGVVFTTNLYFAWNGDSSSGIKMRALSSTLLLTNTFVVDASHQATVMSVCSDLTTNRILVSYYNSGSSTGYSVCVNSSIIVQSNFPTQIISSGTILNLASAAQNGVLSVFYEVSNSASGVQCNYVSSVNVTQTTGAVSSPVVIIRSVGLASKAFIINEIVYFLSVYNSSFQPTYFLINGSLSTAATPVIEAKLAYENGGGYLTNGLPSVSLSGNTASLGTLYKDLIQALSDANSSGTTTVGGIYAQTGINLVNFTVNPAQIVTSEIGSNLNLSGGFLWAYDGYTITEQGFHLYPDSVQNTATATTGGHLTAQIYFYQALYELMDNQGNIFRSAGSIPVEVDLSTSMTTTNTVTLVIPTLRVTAKVANLVKIVLYRWSTAQQNFFQVTSVSAPTLNSTTTDSVTFVDTQADSSILGNSLIYTTGGVIEDTGAPSTTAMTLFDDRLWLVDAEDPNLLWFSKQVIENTPVEMSDLLTVFVNPNVGSTGPTGPVTALAPMDDKLCIFKRNAINYLNGSGPDNTGANNGYSQPTFITSMVGCTNQNSIVFQPEGLMFEFQSEAGNQIWILSRSLQTQYIGAPVEELTKNATVLSAVAIPGTNEVRFTMSSGITLKFDYFYGQWGTHTTNAVSSCLYQDLHTILTPYSQILQETPGQYLDGTSPVLLSFTTSWLNFASLQGFERFYHFYLLGEYLSPHFLNVSLAYDYVESFWQNIFISPDNFSSSVPSAFGEQPAPFGSASALEQWKVFPDQQKCQAFQIKIQEVYDPSLGVIPGAGLSLSGLNLTVAAKRGTRPIRSANTAGGSGA